MSDSLLVALQKYSSRPSYNPIENFTTEAFTWLLRNDKDAERVFLELIKEKSGDKLSLESFDGLETENQHWQTQVRNDGGTADIVGRFKSFTIVVEVKIWSFGSDNQVQKYVNALKKTGIQQVFGVYLTAEKSQYLGKESLCGLLWEEVYSRLQQIDKDMKNWRIQEFLEFLSSQGLSPREPVPCSAWVHSGDVFNMLEQSYSNFRSIKQGLDEAKSREEKENKNGELSQIYRVFTDSTDTWDEQLGWGRVGIRLKRGRIADKDWNPAVFIGFVVDPKNHHYEQLFDRGVLLSLIIDVGSTYWDRLYGGEEWKIFAKELERQAKDKKWLFYNHHPEEPGVREKKWHPLMVYRPMFDILCEEKKSDFQLLENKVMELLHIFSNSGYQDFVNLFDVIDREREKTSAKQ